MKHRILLRIAALLIVFHTAGHTLGALGWTKPANPEVGNVISGMQREHFDFMGRTVTLASFYEGYGVSMIFVLLFVSVQLWLLSANPNKAMLLAMTSFLFVFAVCEYIYFFPFAAVITLLAAIATGLSLISGNKT